MQEIGNPFIKLAGLSRLHQRPISDRLGVLPQRDRSAQKWQPRAMSQECGAAAP
jgi:hypothetical protein